MKNLEDIIKVLEGKSKSPEDKITLQIIIPYAFYRGKGMERSKIAEIIGGPLDKAEKILLDLGLIGPKEPSSTPGTDWEFTLYDNS